MTEKKYNQQAYNATWAEKNRQHANYLKGRSAARSFIRNKATKEDLLELQQLILDRLNEVK